MKFPNKTNNQDKRSSRRFLEETENKMSKPISVGNKFQFNNDGFSNISSMPFQQPIIMKNDYPRRNIGGAVGNLNNNNYNNNNNDLFNNNNSGMMIGDNFNRRENHSINNNSQSNNGILFGMQSRRGHMNNNQAKNFEFKF